MFKYLLVISILICSNFTHANEIKKENKEYTTGMQYHNKIFKKENSILSNNAKKIYENIEKNNALNEYKKYLLNSISTFHILITKDYNNKDLLLQHAKKFFPITICFAYQFDKDSSRQIEIINSTLFNDENLISQFNEAQKYVFEEYLIQKQKVFFENIEKDFFIKKCSN